MNQRTQVGRGSALSRSVLQLLADFQLVLVVLTGPVQVLAKSHTHTHAHTAADFSGTELSEFRGA